MHQPSIIERAIEIAKSGDVDKVEMLVAKLKREGFHSVNTHLHGQGIRKQLLTLIKANQPELPE